MTGCGIVQAAIGVVPSPQGLHETAGFHHPSRRRSRVAAGGARAAGGQVADHRVLGLDHARLRINTLALGARLPTIHSLREYVEANGLMCYGPNWLDQWRRAADYVDKILRGAKPANLPVEQPTRFDLIINLTTAKVLGLMIPETFLLRANEVIE
jgi:hypothetical protein